MVFRDISLQQFGRLMPSFPVGMSGKFLFWACLCDCGNTKVVEVYKLRNGHTQSCGCIRRELNSARNQSNAMRTASSARMKKRHIDPDFKPALTHGHGCKDNLTYKSWTGVQDRCINPCNHVWPLYGGAGVKVCERWRDFSNFLTDLGERPSPKHSLSRFLDIGNYSCGNCDDCRVHGWLHNVEWGTVANQMAERMGKNAMQARRAFYANLYLESIFEVAT